MFERRLKIVLGLIFALSAIMVVRAVQLQMFQRATWRGKAEDAGRRWSMIETPRGSIFDRKKRLVAFDDACIDAAVDYRAISLDPEWLKAQARHRLVTRNDPVVKGTTREQRIEEEIERVKADIDAMWGVLASASGKSAEVIAQTREEILRRVILLRRTALYRRFSRNIKKNGEGLSPWYKRWLVDAQTDDPDQQHDSALDAAKVVVGEQTEAHVILADISNDVENMLRKQLAKCPGLVLRESTHRKYDPVAAVAACQVLGHMAPVDPKDVTSADNAEQDELRKYLPRDQIGRAGVEGLAEPFLRGTKGRLVRRLGNKEPEETVKAIPGGDVTMSIDVQLQQQILEAFKTLTTWNSHDQKEETFHELHGAVVVLDVETNEVLAMASYPTFDMNTYDAEVATLTANDIEGPLLNRATLAHEPGSTVKPIIGSVAVTDGVVRYDKGIPCTGYLIIPDRRTGKMMRLKSTNRCWVASTFASRLGEAGVSGHPIPVPHRGIYGNLDGSLTVSDALERSCNVYFETVADDMHLPGVAAALARFGLGEKTGIGIPETKGVIPIPHPLKPGAKFESEQDRRTAWLAAIGQGQVAATPLQMANVAATLARGGIWKRPRLLKGPSANEIYKSAPDDVRDLHLSPLALQEVKRGMINVVSGPAGTGKLYPPVTEVTVAGKTGSAQTGLFNAPIRDEDHHLVREPVAKGVEGKGRALRRVYLPGTTTRPSELPWFYQGVGAGGEHLAHAWYIGYAPADHPQIAFCAFVEYGGSGGQVAGAVAAHTIRACIEHKYVVPEKGVRAPVASGD
jgi:cell division protein FtsI/penicillin-binding protein 2